MQILNINNMSILPKLSLGNAIPITVPGRFSVQIDKLILKSILKYKEPKIAKTISDRKRIWELKQPHFKTFYKVVAIKRVQ